MTEYDNVKVRDQLGRPGTASFVVKRAFDTVVIEENTTTVYSAGIGNSFILSHTSNGQMGDPELADNGLQVVLGKTGIETAKVLVVNPNRIYREYFNDTYFVNAANTSADWAVNEGYLELTSGERVESDSVAFNDGTIGKGKITVTVDTGSESDLSFQLTSDGGSNWEVVTAGVEHTFDNQGTDLRFLVDSAGTVSVSFLRLSYTETKE